MTSPPAGRSAVERAIAAAGPLPLDELVALDGAVPALVAAAREDLRARRFAAAAPAIRALARAARREAFPGGARGWLEVVAECARVFAFTDWLAPAALEEALALAVEQGELRQQATLAAALGFALSQADRVADAAASFERALDAAGALNDRAVSFEVHVRIAYGHVLQGRTHDAIAIFERLLGDVPEELVPLPPELAPPFATLPEAPLGALGSIYAQVGQLGRGLDMLHRMVAAGERLGRPELASLGHALLSAVHAARRDAAAVRAHAEPAFAYWRRAGVAEPWLLWHAAGALALADVLEGRLAEARAVLEEGQRARLASGVPYFAGSGLYEALDRLDVAGLPPPDGLDLDAEIDRMLRWPGAHARAIALRYRARRRARGEGGDARAAEVDRDLAESVALLRESRVAPLELARSLEEAAAWADRRGRAAEGARLAAEARELYAALDLATPAAGGRRAGPAIVELGRLGALAERRDGAWGEIAARLCAALGAERCALVEAADPAPRALAARGGGPRWLRAVLSFATASPPAAALARGPLESGEDAAAPRGQLLVVPFASARLGRRGWAFLENRHSRPAVGPADEGILAIVEAQLGVVLENVSLWRELADARARLERENRYWREAAPAPAAGPRGRFVGDSPALRRVLGLVERVAPARTTVLVQGETGVGKELVARELHRLSPRRDGPFIAAHVASLAPGLVASALFGHERGAFTGATEQVRGRFELADGGTLFLDEIGELGPEDQVRLLRVLQEGTFERVGGTRPLRSDFRLVAATNRDLAAEVAAGRFREDLYFRLSAFPIHVPPLRERREEIPALALHFLESSARRRAVRFDGVREADMERLLAYAWPGNVRELEHVLERAVLLSDPPQLRIPPLREAAAPARGEWITLEEAERRHVRRVIEKTRGRIAGPGGAAEILGLSPSTLSWRIGKLGLRPALAKARASRGGA